MAECDPSKCLGSILSVETSYCTFCIGPGNRMIVTEAVEKHVAAKSAASHFLGFHRIDIYSLLGCKKSSAGKDGEKGGFPLPRLCATAASLSPSTVVP